MEITQRFLLAISCSMFIHVLQDDQQAFMLSMYVIVLCIRIQNIDLLYLNKIYWKMYATKREGAKSVVENLFNLEERSILKSHSSSPALESIIGIRMQWICT